MNTKQLFVVVGVGIGIISASAFLRGAFAQRGPDPEKLAQIEYPVSELGNCANQRACGDYCEKPQNLRACLDYAEAHDLMDAEQIEKGQRFADAGGEGPGGCDSEKSCKAYCDDVAHIDECIAFGEENNLIPPEELAEAKKVQAAIKAGAELPGDCTSKTRCDDYCNDPNHMEECVAFAEKAGFIPDDELEEVRQVIRAIKEKGAKPPRCRGRDACDEYCNKPANMEECFAFAEAAGFIKPEEAKMARAFMEAGGPEKLGCSGEKCKEFCEQSAENRQKCGEVMGPIFEKNPELIPADAREQMEEGLEGMREAFRDAPPEVIQCIKDKVDPGFVDEVIAGGAPFGKMMRLGPEVGDMMRECFGGGPEGEFPEEAKECLVRVFDVDDMSKLKKPPTRSQQTELEACMEEIMGGPGGEGGGPPEIPEEAKDCVRAAIGVDDFSKLKRRMTPEQEQLVTECFMEAGVGGPGGEPGGEFGDGDHGGFPGAGPSRSGFGPASPEVQSCMSDLGISLNRSPSGDQMSQIETCVREKVGESSGGPPAEGDHQEGFPGEGFPGDFAPPEGFPEGFSPDQFPQGAPTPEQLQQFQGQFQQGPPTQEQIQAIQLQQQAAGCAAGGGTWDPSTNTCQVPSGPGGFLYQPSPQVQLNPPSLLGFFGQVFTELLR